MTLNYIIVEINNAYNNTKKISSDVELVVNTTIESVEHINRIATIIDSPDFTILKAGDKVIVHHNIFRLRNGIKGETIKSNYHIEDNKYFVPLTEIFMYKRNDSDWIALEPYCFVKPIIGKRMIHKGELITPNNLYKGNLKNIGKMIYPNKELLGYGVNKDDKIIFSNNSEYEFIINGELFYKMSTNDILGIYEGT